MAKSYEITGVVYGFLWDGSEGSYPARKISGNNKKELINQAEKMLDDGSLDNGMGYQLLTSALLVIKTIETIKVKGKEYTRETSEEMYIGNPTEKQQEKMFDHYYSLL